MENKLKMYGARSMSTSSTSSRSAIASPAARKEYERFQAFEAQRQQAERRMLDMQISDANKQFTRLIDAKLDIIARRRKVRS